jgi:hypothetical protein
MSASPGLRRGRPSRTSAVFLRGRRLRVGIALALQGCAGAGCSPCPRRRHPCSAREPT